MSTDGEVTIATVLRSGGDYEPKHVAAIAEQLEKHMAAPFRFVCLTDIPGPWGYIKTLPLRDNLPGWWSKMELFREFRSALYLDLDTVLLRDITDLAQPKAGFWMLRDFVYSQRLGSGLMQWQGDYSYLYHEFMDRPAYFMKKHTSRTSWGDQGFISEHLRETATRWQDHYPSRIMSYKKDYLPGKRDTSQLGVLCFHGKPRPWEVQL